MSDTEQLVRRHIDIWNERDGAQRRRAGNVLSTPGVRYTDPLADVVGADAIDTTIGAVQAEFPDLAFSIDGGLGVQLRVVGGGAFFTAGRGRLGYRSHVDAHHDTARFTWGLGSRTVRGRTAGDRF